MYTTTNESKHATHAGPVIKNVYYTINSERRKQQREGIAFTIEYSDLNAKEYNYTVGKNLSEGGIKIISENFMAKGDELKVHINFIDKVLNLKARVAWCAKEKWAQRYTVGLQFTQIPQPAKNEITSYLKKMHN